MDFLDEFSSYLTHKGIFLFSYFSELERNNLYMFLDSFNTTHSIKKIDSGNNISIDDILFLFLKKFKKSVFLCETQFIDIILNKKNTPLILKYCNDNELLVIFITKRRYKIFDSVGIRHFSICCLCVNVQNNLFYITKNRYGGVEKYVDILPYIRNKKINILAIS